MVNMSKQLPCLVETCTRRSPNLYKPGYCKAHQKRIRTHGDPLEHIPVTTPLKVRDCYVKGCKLQARARGLCSTHSWRLKNWGVLEREGTTPKFRAEVGERRVDKSGYAKIKQPDHPEAHSNGWVFEHRMVMSNHLGRPLTPDENVHHLNGVRDDNRLENLEVWSTAQPSGQRAKDKIDFSLYILRLYCPDLLKDI